MLQVPRLYCTFVSPCAWPVMAVLSAQPCKQLSTLQCATAEILDKITLREYPLRMQAAGLLARRVAKLIQHLSLQLE